MNEFYYELALASLFYFLYNNKGEYMKSRNHKMVTVTPKAESSILLGHPWIYGTEILKRDNINNGEIVDVLNNKEKYLGTGFYNNNSKITIRLLSRNTNDLFDYEFFKRRIKYAYEMRKQVMNDLNSFRLIYGEADGFPGLTVDKFNNILVTQTLSLGIEARKDLIFKALVEVLEEDNIDINGIYERNDVDVRLLEGLTEYKGWYQNKVAETKIEIVENGIKYIVDFENGQKTGYFLDQKYNRLKVREFAKGKTVLDCCTHTGSFAMNAYIGGAKRVVALDISEKALEDSKRNFDLNHMQIETICSDVFEYLESISNKKLYDFIILDPPAFTKSRKTINQALKGYQELNYLAMKALPRGGYLVTASCSHFAYEELFKEAIFKASLKANVQLKQLYISGPSPDHPELIGVSETKYLKFFIFQVV